MTARKMMDSSSYLEQSEASTKRRHDGQELQASDTHPRPPRYKKARKSVDRVSRQRQGYSRYQGGTRIRSYAPSRGGRSRDCPGRGRGHQDKRRQQDGRCRDDERRRNKPQREREERSRPKRERDEDMHLAESEEQQSVVESEASPSPSQESTGSVDIGRGSDCLDDQYHVDVGKTGDELKSIAVDSELRNDMVETALDEEADRLASNLPQEEAVTEDSEEESIPSEKEEKADNWLVAPTDLNENNHLTSGTGGTDAGTEGTDINGTGGASTHTLENNSSNEFENYFSFNKFLDYDSDYDSSREDDMYVQSDYSDIESVGNAVSYGDRLPEEDADYDHLMVEYVVPTPKITHLSATASPRY